MAGACLLASRAQAASAARPYREGEVIIRFQTHLAGPEMAAVATKGDPAAVVARSLAAVGRPHTTLVRFPKSIPVETMVARYKALPGVLSVEPNYVGRVFLPKPGSRIAGSTFSPPQAGYSGPFNPNDPDYALNHMVYAMDYLAIWPDKSACPMVAVLSSGADATHPDLVGRLVKGNDWVNGDKDPDDDFGYGTHEAGLVAASINNAKGSMGLSNGKVLVIKVMDSQGYWTIFDVASGINDAANNALVKIIYFDGWIDLDIPLINSAVQAAVDKGKLLVFPAGDQVTGSQYPAAYSDSTQFPGLAPSVISVAPSGIPDPSVFYGLNYGCLPSWANAQSWVSVLAPGVGTYATTPTHPFWLNTQYGVPFGYSYLDGGSEAAAAVAALAARTWSVMPPGTTASQVKDRVVSTAWSPVSNPKTTMIDTDGDSVPDTLCQPATMNDNARQPDFAAAMNRHEFYGRAFDAQTGAPLNKGTVTAFLNGKQQGSAAIVDSYIAILDLPNDNVNPYDVKVNVPGYTAGTISFASVLAGDCGGGANTHNCWSPYPGMGGIALPKNLPGQVHVVTDWAWGSMETHLFTPTAGPIQCDVGVTPLSSMFCFLGSLTSAPMARMLYHGGNDPSVNGNLNGIDLISIKAPLYPTSPGVPYEIFVTDHGSGQLFYQYAITRVWAGGKIIGTVIANQGDIATNSCSTYGGSGTNACDTLYVGDLSQAGVFTAKGIYGTSSAAGPPGVLPYTAVRTTPINRSPR
jgi:thermitase